MLGCLLAFTLFSCVSVGADDTNVTLDPGYVDGVVIRFHNPVSWKNGTHGDLQLVANETWIQDTELVFHELRVYDYSLTQQANASVQMWREDLTELTHPDDFWIMGVITEIDHHAPYGELETRVEVLKVEENNTIYDWYDVSVYQSLTPGANISGTWEWNWIQYTMNGTYGGGNIDITEYDQPSSHEPPKGIFTFLWRILGFDLREYLPWLRVNEPVLAGSDLSDSTKEVYRVRYLAPREYPHRDEPLEIRHHYVLRVGDGENPVFWHQTQVQYTQADDFAQLPYITPPMADGYIAVN